jgi:hypothetical protein
MSGHFAWAGCCPWAAASEAVVVAASAAAAAAAEAPAVASELQIRSCSGGSFINNCGFGFSSC